MPTLYVYSYICPSNGEVNTYVSPDIGLTTLTTSECENGHSVISPISITNKFYIVLGFSQNLLDGSSNIQSGFMSNVLLIISPGDSVKQTTRTIYFPDPRESDEWLCLKTNETHAPGTTLTLSCPSGITFSENNSQTINITQNGRYLIFIPSMDLTKWERLDISKGFRKPIKGRNIKYLRTYVEEVDAVEGLKVIGGNSSTITGDIFGLDNRYDKQPEADINTQNGIFRIGGKPVIAGTYYKYSESNGESSTTSTDFQTKLTLITDDIPSGVYRIGYSWECTNTKKESYCTVHVYIDDNTLISNMTHCAVRDYNKNGGFYHASLSNGVKTIKIKFRNGQDSSIVDDDNDSKGEARIRNARIEFWKLV